jgi:choline transporter-like protein 2/4/5
MWVIAALYYLVLCCNWKSLRIAISIIETAADFFADTKRIAFVPMFYFAIWCGVFVFWVWGVCGVASITSSEIKVTSVQFQDKDVNRSDATNWMSAGMVLGMLWISAFIMACNEFAVICAAASWYFSRKDIPDDDGIPGDSDVLEGFKWTFRYHVGTLALGSFILTIVWVIRAIFEYIGEKMNKASGNNACTKCLVSCISCCLDCFDRFIRYLNRNAFIYCAISSENFCPSALHSFLLILKNHAKFAFVEGIADGFMFLAKSFIAVLTTLAGYFLLGPMTGIKVDPTMPCIFIFLFAYFVASQFISIFDVSANTILQCYLFDADIAKHHG